MRANVKLRFQAGAKGQKGEKGDPAVIDYASESEAEAGTDPEKVMTPLTTKQAAISRGLVSSADFGVKADGTSDDTAALAAFLQYCASENATGFIPKGIVSVTGQEVIVSGDLDIRCEATIRNRDGSSMPRHLLRVTGPGARSSTINWRGGFFDCNGGAYSGLEIKNWRKASVFLDEGANIVCSPSSTGSTSNLVFANITTGFASWGLMRDCSEGTSTQGSLPRAFSVSQDDNLRTDTTVQAGDIRDHHGCIVIGHTGPVASPGTVTIYGGRGTWRDTADNGIYLVGRASSVDVYDLVMDNVEEPLVNSGGTCFINYYGGAIINPKNSIGLQDGEGIRLKGTRIQTKYTVARTRGPGLNTSSGSFVIEDCDIEVRGAQTPFIFNHGTLKVFREINCRIRIINDSTIGALPQNLLQMTGDATTCAFDCIGGEWSVEDATADMVAQEYYINVPTVTRQCRIESKLVNQTGKAGVVPRFVNARQKLVGLSGTFSAYNAQRDTPQNNALPDQGLRREVYSDTYPSGGSSGYWNKGDLIWNTNPLALGPMGWICTASGQPGTWSAMSPIILSGVTTYDFPSIGPGTAQTRAVTVTGAQVGDFVIGIAMSNYVAGVIFSGQVSAADVVNVLAFNATASSIDPSSGQLRIRLMRLSAA